MCPVLRLRPRFPTSHSRWTTTQQTAYILGYYGHTNGLQDGNVNPNGPNLANGMGPLVDEGFGLSAAGDSWADQTAATINARIAGGVVAANITTSTPSYLQTNVTTTLAPSALNTTCF
jgi:hypothetical protein